MPIYKIKEQIMKNLLFTFLNIDLQNIYISLIIYRDINSIYITNIITKKNNKSKHVSNK